MRESSDGCGHVLHLLPFSESLSGVCASCGIESKLHKDAEQGACISSKLLKISALDIEIY